MKKRIFGLALSALAVVGLVSCGGGSDEIQYGEVNTKFTVWAADKEIEVINAVIKKYNDAQENDADKFNVDLVPVTEADAGTTVAKDPTVAGAPALFLCADDHIYNLISKDIALEVQGTYKDRVVNNIAESSVTAASYNGKLYGFPVTSDNGYFLWYNKKHVTEEEVGSLESLLAKAKSLGKKVLMDIPNGYYANSFFMSPEACGTDSLRWSADADGKIKYTCSWDDTTGVKVADYIKNLLVPYYADGTFVVGGNDVILAGFQDDSIIAAVSGTWMEADLLKAAGDNLAATKLPTYTIDEKAYQMASFSGTKVYCINKTRPAAEQRAAAALADLLTTYESQITRYQMRSSIPCNNQAAASEEFVNNATISSKALFAQNEFAAVQSQSAEARYCDIGKAIGQYLIDGQLGSYKDTAALLKANVDQLRVAQ